MAEILKPFSIADATIGWPKCLYALPDQEVTEAQAAIRLVKRTFYRTDLFEPRRGNKVVLTLPTRTIQRLAAGGFVKEEEAMDSTSPEAIAYRQDQEPGAADAKDPVDKQVGSGESDSDEDDESIADLSQAPEEVETDLGIKNGAEAPVAVGPLDHLPEIEA